jgi:hypothetical protein
MDYLTPVTQPECHIYSNQEVFNYNFFIWTLAYFVGLQFTHLDNGILSQLTLDWNVMKNWPWYMWVIFTGLVALLATVVSYIFYLYALIGYMQAYINLFLGAIAVLSLATKYYQLWGYHLM